MQNAEYNGQHDGADEQEEVCGSGESSGSGHENNRKEHTGNDEDQSMQDEQVAGSAARPRVVAGEDDKRAGVADQGGSSSSSGRAAAMSLSHLATCGKAPQEVPPETGSVPRPPVASVSGGAPTVLEALRAARKVMTGGKFRSKGNALPLERAPVQPEQEDRDKMDISWLPAPEVPGLDAEPTAQDRRLWALLQCCPLQAACVLRNKKDKHYLRPWTKEGQDNEPMVAFLAWLSGPEGGESMTPRTAVGIVSAPPARVCVLVCVCVCVCVLVCVCVWHPPAGARVCVCVRN